MTVNEISDKKIWESFIRDNAPQSLFQSWNWGEVIKKEQTAGNKLWRFGLFNPKLSGIAQVSKVRARRGTFLHVRHGPVLKKWHKLEAEFLLTHLKNLAHQEKASFIRISPLVEKEKSRIFQELGFSDAPIHRMDGEICWVLDLNKNEDELLMSMRKTTRYLIRQALKLNVVIKKSKSPEDLEKFLALYRQTAQRHHFVEHKSIREEFQEFLKDDGILLFQGYFKNTLLSAALILFYQNQAIYHHSASIEQKIPVNYLLQWEVIREAKKRGLSVYNFWGIAPEGNKRHPWQNLTLFKRGFGGRAVEFGHAKDLPIRKLSYSKTFLIESARRILKGY